MSSHSERTKISNGSFYFQSHKQEIPNNGKFKTLNLAKRP